MPVLTIEGLSVAFGDVPVVQDLSLSIKRGETLALVGESGSGKSLTALAVMGLLPRRARRTEGRILLGGTDISSLDENGWRRIRGARIGMIFQEPMTSLTPVLTVERQMTEALVIHRGLSMSEARSRAMDMLTRAGITEVERRMRQYPHEFSGGMRQRVMIAMTLALEPELLIADEPTTALDVTVQAQILDLIRTLTKDNGTSLLLITHDMGVVAEMADRVAVMRHGRLVETETTANILARPEQAYTKQLLSAVPRMDGPARDDLVQIKAVPAVELREIGRSFRGRGFLAGSSIHRVLQDVSLTVAADETLALVGESGSGKSTLGRIASRLDLAHEGSVWIEGDDITGLRGGALRRARAKVQMIFQDPYASLDPRFTAAQTLSEPLVLHRGLSGKALRTEAARLLDLVRLPAGLIDRLPHELSGGQRQRIAIARALAAEPRVIIADEPTSALDVSVQSAVLDLMREIQRQTGIAYLFIAHDLAVVRSVAHRVAVMKAGQIVEIGSTRDVMDQPRHPYTQALIGAVPKLEPRRTAS
jgi:ABC-type glutathione transport system ATPase component